jgi:methionyl-tRNA synthetase
MASIPTQEIPSLDQFNLQSSLGLSAGGTTGYSNTGSLPYLSGKNPSADLGQYMAIAGGLSLVILAVAVWSMIWKGIALWYAARRGEKGWFVALLILNTVGILEIIYVFAVAKRSDVVVNKPEPPTPSTLPKI